LRHLFLEAEESKFTTIWATKCFHSNYYTLGYRWIIQRRSLFQLKFSNIYEEVLLNSEHCFKLYSLLSV
jgi:hypothetical protein